MSNNAFSGSIPANYRTYLVPLLFADYASELATATAVPPGGAVLETACGTGAVTSQLAQQLAPDVRIVATDINEAMLDLARQEFEGAADGSRVECRPADATDLPFDDQEFDAVVCQFGVMFYADRGQAYAEARRVLRPDGSFHFNIWDSLTANPLVQRVHETVVEMFPQDPPRFLEIPWSYNDPALVERELRDAGFGAITITPSPRLCRAPSARDVTLAFAAGSPLAPQLAERGDLGQITESLQGKLEQIFGAGPIEAPMRALVVEAKP